MKKAIMEILKDLAKGFYCGELLRKGIPADSVISEMKLIEAHNRKEAEKWVAEI